MAKHIKDPGLQYMMELGFYPAKNMSGVEEQLIKASDRQTAQSFLELIEYRSDDHTDDWNNEEFYAQKNKNYSISQAITSAFDSDILRQVCNWIVANQKYFGKTILEVGCDCGVMSGFLGRLFPDANIVAIDRCEAAIVNAKKLAEKMNICNVSFKACDLRNMDGTFETVFSMRTVNENGIPDDESMRDYEIKDLSEQADVQSAFLSDYCHNLRMRMEKGGRLISIERMWRDAVLLGWMEALHNNGMTFDLSCYTELRCKEVGEDSEFRTFIAFATDEERATPKELFDFACSKYLDYSRGQYEGDDARIVFENRRKDMMEGYLVESQKLGAKAVISLWSHRTDKTCLISYQNNWGHVRVSFHDISHKDELLLGMHGLLKEAREHGDTVQELH